MIFRWLEDNNNVDDDNDDDNNIIFFFKANVALWQYGPANIFT